MTDIKPGGRPGEIPVVFVDDPKAPEVFVSWVVGVGVDVGNIRLTFATHRINHETHPGPVNRVVNLRVVMPTSTAQALAAGLYDYLKNIGQDPVPKPPSSTVQ